MIECYGFVNLLRAAQRHQSTEKERESGPDYKPTTSALCIARDQKLVGILTGAAPDCGLLSSKISPTPGWFEIAVKAAGRGKVEG